MTKLDPGYTVEIDGIGKDDWNRLVRDFEDASIYQTWSYGAVRFGSGSLSHLVLKRNGAVVAAAQAVVKTIPVLHAGIAYLYWGPLWHARGVPEDPEVFAQVLRALRNEYVVRRGLVLRTLPVVFEEDGDAVAAALSGEGYSALPHGRRQRTLLIDLTSSLPDLRKGLDQKWRNCLNKAERSGLELREGDDDGLFGMFIDIYREMHSRKNFTETSDVREFRTIQQDLPEQCKMKVMVCLRSGEPVAGAVVSAVGSTGVYLFGATNNNGMSSNGSYLLQWKAMEWLKSMNCSRYDLHGIDPSANPGTYRFKSGLCGSNGREVRFLGHFDSRRGLVSALVVRSGEAVKSLQQNVRHVLGSLGRRSKSASRETARAGVSS